MQLVILVFYCVADFETTTRNRAHRHGYFFYWSTYNTKTTSYVRCPSLLLELHVLKLPRQMRHSSTWFFFFVKLLRPRFVVLVFCVFQALKPG